MIIKRFVMTATALLTLLAATGVMASPSGKAIKSFVDNRFNNNLYPELSNPCDPADADCKDAQGGRSFDLSGDGAYWGAWRTSLGDGGTTNINVCGPHAGIWSFITWNGESTGSVAEVLEKFDGVSATITLDGKAMRVLVAEADTWETRIDSLESVGRKVLRTCLDHMTTLTSDDPKEAVRNAGENCWSKTFGVDLSQLDEGEHTLVTNFDLLKGFPGADAACGDPGFDNDNPCFLTYTRTINVNVPGGCKGSK